jgi:kynurenine formamidase
VSTSNWGRWGSDDQAGSLNHITAASVMGAVGLITRGTVLRLDQAIGPATVVPPHRKRVERFMTRDGGDYAAGARRPGEFQFAEDVWSFAAHTGTHIDALSHAWYDDQLYNGYPSTGVRSTSGAQHCGAEQLRPIVTRGLLLDVAALSEAPMGPGDAVTAELLAAAAAAADVRPEAGDAVLIRTGWLGLAGRDPARYFAGEPGLDLTAAAWLADADVAIVGSDNFAVEVQPSAPDTMFPVHQLLIRDQGIPLIEGMVLDVLAARGVAQFCFVAAPLPLVGGTASPVCPLAVF